MVTAVFEHHGRTIALFGTLTDILMKLRAWCPGGKVMELFQIKDNNI